MLSFVIGASCGISQTQPSCPYSQFLGQELERIKLIIQPVEFPAKDIFIMALFLFQGSDLDDPTLQNSRAATTAFDEVVGPILFDIFHQFLAIPQGLFLCQLVIEELAV